MPKKNKLFSEESKESKSAEKQSIFNLCVMLLNLDSWFIPIDECSDEDEPSIMKAHFVKEMSPKAMDYRRREFTRAARRAQREIDRYKKTQMELEMLDDDFMPYDFADQKRYKH